MPCFFAIFLTTFLTQSSFHFIANFVAINITFQNCLFISYIENVTVIIILYNF